MPLDRETIAQLGRLLRPLVTRVANTVARAVVHFADDGKKQQVLQVGALAGETIDNAEHFQAYGFSSVPIAGAEAIVIFPNGDRSHPLVIATSDRSNRPTGGQPGEVTVYNNTGAKAVFKANGDVVVSAKPGGHVLVDDGAGGAGPLVTKADFDGHTHPAPGGATSAPTSPAAGTTVLKAK